MENDEFSLSRRAFVGSTVALATSCLVPVAAHAQPTPQQQTIGLRVIARTRQLSPELPPSPIWELASAQPDAALRFTRGDEISVLLSNEVSSPIVLNWLGFDGIQALEPLTGATTVPGGSQGKIVASLRQAGTFLIDPRLFGDNAERPFSTSALVVEGAKRSGAERDETLLIEDWRVKPDGTALSPGQNAEGANLVYTVNGRPARDIELQQNERLRLRIINGCQRSPIGVKIANFEVRVLAIDSQPAEPFVAHDGQLVLAPGSRIDAMMDATLAPATSTDIVMHDGTGPRTIGRIVVTKEPPQRPSPLPPAAPLSSAHLPAQLDLQRAQRVDLQLDAKAPWSTPANFSAGAPPVVQIKRGRVVVMAITNPTATPVAFRVHGHHFRLLDRLDDGWKPFWLDTLMLDKGQTQRIAFLAEHAGQWLIESASTNWSAPRLVRFYAVS